MSADAPTPFELLRAVEQLRKDMRDGFGQLHKRLDGMPTAEVLELTRQGFDHRVSETEKDIADLDAKREQAERDRRVDLRWRIGLAIGVAAPFLRDLWETSRGAVS